MLSLSYLAALTATCLLMRYDSVACQSAARSEPAVAGQVSGGPVFTGEALGVELTAAAALVWDLESGNVLYEKAADERRPIASLTKLLSGLTVRHHLPVTDLVEITPAVVLTQRRGVHVRLPAGEHVLVRDLLSAGLVASANDAMTALAVAVAGSEEDFAQLALAYAARLGLTDTKVSNATGLTDGEQYSTARDVRRMFEAAYRDELLRSFLRSPAGILVTREGSRRRYTSTNELLDTYLPVLAAKTGYTEEAGENLVMMTAGERGQRVGAVVLGSQNRFQDMKVLVGWIWRNYRWL